MKRVGFTFAAEEKREVSLMGMEGTIRKDAYLLEKKKKGGKREVTSGKKKKGKERKIDVRPRRLTQKYAQGKRKETLS